MSEGLSRRQFVKTGAVGTALLGAGAAGLLSFSNWIQEAGAEEAESEERIAYTYHQEHCGGYCSLKCTVRNGRLCLIEPNDNWENSSRRVCCVRGLSEIQNIYSTERIQTPLKRVGERGAGEFVAISWDEAIDTIAKAVKDSQEQYGKDSVLLRLSAEPKYPLLASILGCQTGGFTGEDVGVGNGLDPSIGYVPGTWVGVNYAISTNDARDLVNSKYFINVGSNYLESSMGQVSYFFDAKEAGCHIITVDPHFSTTASKSDEWIPIIPGTDTALFLGMARVIIEKQLYNEDFMREKTAFPFLVNEADKTLLREHPVDSVAGEPETLEQNPYLVWDENSGSLQPFNAEGIKPSLEASGTTDGKTYRTVFSVFKENQEDYTLTWAAETTGISEDKIAYLAECYADGPSSLGLGWGGVDKFANADTVGHAAAVLVALTGNIGTEGAGVGVYVGHWNGDIINFGTWPLPEDMVPSAPEMNFFEMPYKPNNVHVYLSFGDKIVQETPNLNRKIEWLKTLDLIVYCDIHFSSGGVWADIVLPACSKFECDKDFGGVRAGNGLLMTQQKVLDPLFEAKPDFVIEREIGKAMGFEHYLPKSQEDIMEVQVDPKIDPRLTGITLSALKNSPGGIEIPNLENPRVAYRGQQFCTPTKRMEIYYEAMIGFDQQLPRYEEPHEASVSNPLREKYPLQCCSARNRYHIHNQFGGASWIQQFNEPRIELNPVDFHMRNLQEGDVCEVFNERGSFKCKTIMNEAVRPGSMRFAEGSLSQFMVEGNLQNVTNEVLTERGMAQPAGPDLSFNDTLVEVRKASAREGGAS
ncbi:MAG: molybdopterin-dependent oxidoreductase [Coriobacteriales bacterium]|jgi:molybdopterin-containing oxidoreductase family molybdopterin binding subunit|nr:molybdopterin-dependent oxidoreductase [Coriobacteriales bacterium]